MRFAIFSILAAASTCAVQTQAQSIFTWLEPVEQGVGDVSDLGVSIRRVEEGLAMPTGFRTVYKLRNQEGTFIRASGAVYAAFPQSVYAKYRNGHVPQIPASTVFYIGAPPEWMEQPSSEISDHQAASTSVTPDGIDTRINLRVEAERPVERPVQRISSPDEPFPEPVTMLPPIIGDEGYRHERWAQMLSAAAGEPSGPR
jgi:hypothetical protein